MPGGPLRGLPRDRMRQKAPKGSRAPLVLLSFRGPHGASRVTRLTAHRWGHTDRGPPSIPTCSKVRSEDPATRPAWSCAEDDDAMVRANRHRALSVSRTLGAHDPRRECSCWCPGQLTWPPNPARTPEGRHAAAPTQPGAAGRQRHPQSIQLKKVSQWPPDTNPPWGS